MQHQGVNPDSGGFSMVTDVQSPLVATAIHAGHVIRNDLLSRLALSDADRLREEDPFTDQWVKIAGNQIVVHTSRFEVDLNRPPETAVYQRPEDAWGLNVWKEPLEQGAIDKSLGFFHDFYRQAFELLSNIYDRHGFFVVLDLHSYNHRRQGPRAPADPSSANPEVNIGTGNLDRSKWGFVVDDLMAELREFDFLGRQLDVRENVKFKGGYFSRWIQDTFAGKGCGIAIEFKKFFMDEWSGAPAPHIIDAIYEALSATTSGVLANGLAAAGQD